MELLQRVWAVASQLGPPDTAARAAAWGEWALLPVMGGERHVAVLSAAAPDLDWIPSELSRLHFRGIDG